MGNMTYEPKEENAALAQEVLDLLRQKELPIWQAKEILNEAIRLTEWQTMK